MQPLLTPLVLSAERRLRPDSRPPLSSSARTEPSIAWALANTAWGAGLVALIAVLAQSDWDVGMLILSIVPAAALLAVYAALIPRTVVAGPRWLPQIDVEEDLVSLSSHIGFLSMAALGVQTCVFGFPGIDFALPALLLGLTKASAVYFIIQTVRRPLSPTNFQLTPLAGPANHLVRRPSRQHLQPACSP